MRSISTENRYLLTLSLTAVAVFALDQISKHLALSYLVDSRPLQVLGSFLRLTLVYNEGGAFSVKLGSGLFYVITMVVVIIFLLVMLYRQSGRSKILEFSLAAILGGAIGNLADRLRLGKVIDFIDMDFLDISIGSFSLRRWPVFNVADIAVTVGVILIAFLLIFERKKPRDV